MPKQFENLLLEPMRALPSSALPEQIFIVVDALDECEDDQQIQTLLRLLKQIEDITTARIQIMVTSRPDISLIRGFGDMPESLLQDVRLEEAQTTSIKSDLGIFFDHEFAQIKKSYPRRVTFGRPLPEEWPEDKDVQVLADKAYPLFIVASTICRYISLSKTPENELKALLSAQKHNYGPSSGLAEVYLTILQQATTAEGRQSTGDELSELRTVIGSLILLYDPLSATALSHLLNEPILSIGSFIVRLQSVLDIGKLADGQIDPYSPIKPFHLSFRDFLVDATLRNIDEGKDFHIHEAKTHHHLAEQCLRLLSSGPLKEDVCQIKAPGTRRAEVERSRVLDHLPREVEYACIYWVRHAAEGQEALDDNGSVYEFLKQHFLHWFEAMSWLGKASQVIRDIAKLLGIKDVSHMK